jgi:hypothetical protein
MPRDPAISAGAAETSLQANSASVLSARSTKISIRVT